MQLNGLLVAFDLGLALVAIGGCDRPPDPSARGTSLQEQPTEMPAPVAGPVSFGRIGGETLVISRVVWSSPEGGDLPDRFELALRTDDGRMRALPVHVPVVAAAVWNGSAVALDVDDVLWRVAPGVPDVELARNVVGDLGTSEDGTLLAYAQVPGETGEVHVRTPQSDIVVARGLGSAGLFRFTPDGSRVVFSGSRSGGVIGLWVARAGDDGDLRCLTNCSLRAGEPWDDNYVEPPGSREGLRVDAVSASWTTSSRISVRIVFGVSL